MGTLTRIIAVYNYLPYIHNNVNNEHDKPVIAFSLNGESGIAVYNASNPCVVMFVTGRISAHTTKKRIVAKHIVMLNIQKLLTPK